MRSHNNYVSVTADSDSASEGTNVKFSTSTPTTARLPSKPSTVQLSTTAYPSGPVSSAHVAMATVFAVVCSVVAQKMLLEEHDI